MGLLENKDDLKYLVDNLNFKEGVLVIGAGDHFEIWNKVSWEKEYGRLS